MLVENNNTTENANTYHIILYDFKICRLNNN